MTTADYTIDADLDGDGLFETDLTADVRANPGLSITRGSQVRLPLAQPSVGSAALELGNDAAHGAGEYSPGGSTPVTKGTRIRIRATDPTTSLVHPLFEGLVYGVEHHPEIGRQSVGLVADDPFALLIGASSVATALYTDVRTDVALGHLLDAVGWPKNAGAYLAGLSPTGSWPLDETSGQALDVSGNANHGTVTLGSGVRGVTALDDAGDGALEFDGVATVVKCGSGTANDNNFDGGGSLWFLFKPTGTGCNGTSTQPIVISRSNVSLNVGSYVRLISYSSAAWYLEFTMWFDDPAQAAWRTTNRVISDSSVKGYAVRIDYNADSPANDPTVQIYDLDADTITTYTVGSGLTETTTPSGTRRSDAAGDLWIGDWQASPTVNRAFEGVLGRVALWKGSQPTQTEFKGWVARSLNAPRHLDAGLTTLGSWWTDDAMKPWEEAQALKNTEGPGANLYVDGTGAIVFKNRHHRVLATPSTTVQTTFRGTGTEPLHSEPLAYDDGKDDVVNFARYEVVRRSAKTIGVIWSLEAAITLAPGETRQYVIGDAERTPFTALATPTSPTDYQVDAGSLASVSIDRSSGAQATLTLTAGASGATVSGPAGVGGIQARAQLVSVDAVTPVATTLDTSVSQAQHGLRTWDFGAFPVRAEIAVDTAQDWVNAVPSWWQDGRPKLVPLTLRANRSTAALTAALAREIGDRIAVHSARMGLAGEEFWIERIEHRIGEAKEQVTRMFAQQATSVTYFTIGVSELDGVDVLGW